MAITIDSFLGVNQQTDSYTLVLLDAWQIVEINKATATNLTVPPNSEVAFPVNTRIWVKRTGAGVVTIEQGSGVTVTGSSGVLTDAGLNVEMCLRKTGTNTWDLQNGKPANELSWTPVFTGFSSQPTGIVAAYQMITPDLCYFRLWMNDATTALNNATTLTFTGPFTAKTGVSQPSLMIPVLINNTSSTSPGRALITAGSNVISCFTNMSNGAWTSGVDKRVFLSGLYVVD